MPIIAFNGKESLSRARTHFRVLNSVLKTMLFVELFKNKMVFEFEVKDDIFLSVTQACSD